MPTKLDYTELDAAILKSVKLQQPITFSNLFAGAVKRIASQLAGKANGDLRPSQPPIDTWRMVDRRLQALRKKGLVEHGRLPDGWRIPEQKAVA